jgi:DNA-binding response OmpR family regulator
MKSFKPILFVKGEKKVPGLSPDLSGALSRVGYQVMIADISEIESVVTWYFPVLAIASLPGGPESDLQVCHLLLRALSAPVIVISPLDDVNCRVAAFDAGIEDYLISPVNPLIVVARVRNVLRRRSPKIDLQKKESLFTL